MTLMDKKYQILTSIGAFLILSSVLFNRYLKNEMIYGLSIGFAGGWICAALLLKYLIIKEQNHKAKLEGKKVLQEIQEIKKN